MKKRSKKAALELSIGTIVIIVLAVSMLILGIVLIRSIMCSAIGLTGEVNEKVRGELNKLFGATGGEVQCIGSGGESVKIKPGETNIVNCLIKASETAEYEIKVVNYGTDLTSLTDQQIESWLVTSSFKGNIAPGDDAPKKVIRLRIPDNAPEAGIFFIVEITKDGELISTQSLDFEISRTGFVRSTIC